MGLTWNNRGCHAWQAGLGMYYVRLRKKGSKQVARERAIQSLPAILQQRSPASLLWREFETIVTWKLGQQFNLAQAVLDANKLSDLAAKTAEAFAEVPDCEKPIRVLMELDRIGVPVASAILAAAYPEHYGVIDKYTGPRVPNVGKPPYTYKVRAYGVYCRKLREKADELTARCGKPWTPRMVEMALWGDRDC